MDEMKWRKSSYTGANGGDCVEVAELDSLIAVRDSKDPDGPRLALTVDQWRTLISRVKGGGHNPHSAPTGVRWRVLCCVWGASTAPPSTRRRRERRQTVTLVGL
jgi:hypothetical protein